MGDRAPTSGGAHLNGILAICVNAAGQVAAVSTGTPASWNSGQAYVGTSPLMVTEAVAAGDTWNGGFRYRSDGALRIVDATAGLPANSRVNQQGIAQATDGAVCYTSDAPGSGTVIVGGVGCLQDGRLHVALT